jgi:isopentenyl-diphosphate Delta-isomerase
MEEVILVDERDNVIGTMEKMEAHRQGKLHRAFSVILLNSAGEMLLQKRAKSKYHSAGLWTNTCCSHPLPNENIEDAAARRLKEEMGIELRPNYAYKFIYKAHLDSNLTEHELDHVFIGKYDGKPNMNSAEVEDWKFVNIEWLRQDMKKNPNHYTEWFKLIMEKYS